MSTLWQPGQLLFVGFEGTQLPGELAELISTGRVGGVILFARNLRDPHQVRRLVEEIHGHAGDPTPITIAIDQEGGRVQRLRDPWTVWPPMRRLGDHGDVEATATVARSIARELLDVGVGLDFAPVVDVDTNPKNPVIGDRSFSGDVARVCEHAGAFIAAMQQTGVAACAKHFPGHGDTKVDSHLELPRVLADMKRLREVELKPFAAAKEANVATMMTAHVVFEAIDRRRPATMSPDVMAFLRHDIGFDNLVFSDDLEMKAVADHYRPAEIVDATLEAGVDALLVCRQLGLAREVLSRLERQPDHRLEPAITRMVEFKNSYGSAPRRALGRATDALGDRCPPYPDHRRLADRFGS